MDFDKSKVYTAVNGDELQIGSKCIFSDTMDDLKIKFLNVEDYIDTLEFVCNDDEAERFLCKNTTYLLAYLIEPPAEPKYKPFESIDKAREAINKHGGWVSSRDCKNYFFIISYATNLNERIGICTGPIWHNLQELYDNFIFADDGTPCGELVEA
ncbi:hypothetical protein [Treponema denticola]|uniref:hypothetical protein n=1 Tax=Treponema denticola TaxID=158 RepID=UPI0020A2B781|nr:hypothetical protein [Treponema denticola]UTC92507.1 hypothetical protein E4N84_05150 [Treponema denticola]